MNKKKVIISVLLTVLGIVAFAYIFKKLRKE